MAEAEIYYIDTSALLPYYREEAMSQPIQDLLISLKPPVLISDLTKVEFLSAVSRWTRTGEINEVQAVLIENTFNKDVHSRLFEARRVMPEHFSQAEKWLSSMKTALRTLDALHIACSWGYDAKLITCDTIMHQSANKLGIENIFFE